MMMKAPIGICNRPDITSYLTAKVNVVHVLSNFTLNFGNEVLYTTHATVHFMHVQNVWNPRTAYLSIEIFWSVLLATSNLKAQSALETWKNERDLLKLACKGTEGRDHLKCQPVQLLMNQIFVEISSLVMKEGITWNGNWFNLNSILDIYFKNTGNYTWWQQHRKLKLFVIICLCYCNLSAMKCLQYTTMYVT